MHTGSDASSGFTQYYAVKPIWLGKKGHLFETLSNGKRDGLPVLTITEDFKLCLLRDFLPSYPTTILYKPHLIYTISWSSTLVSSPHHLQLVTDTFLLLSTQRSVAPPLQVSECLLTICSYFLSEVAATCACLLTG